MGANRSICTGEAALPRPLTEEEFKYECVAEFLATFFCSWYGVEEPRLQKNPEPQASRTFGGWYHVKTKTVSYNREWQGIVMHELAHHICHMLGKNGTGKHGAQFTDQLQEMIDNWR